jgi:carbonic anhydrase
VAIDPMQDLRERLAAKLGATKAGEGKAEQVVRVSTQPDGELQLTTQPDPPRKPRVAKTPAQKPAASHDSGHWSYDGESGPQSWGQLKPEFSKCASGTRQSPIDIRDGIRVDLEPVQFDYKPSAFRVLDNGHTVQVNVAPGNSIEVMGRRFELAQFHFHRPSEERIDGKQFDMVAHLVHKDADGRLAVVAVLLERGSAHALVQSVWNNLPLEKGDEVSARAPLDLNQLLPKDTRYFTYMGSLTTPPCSEGVLWMVMQQPVSVSGEQIDVFARLYPMNARPVQQASGRLIKQSN